MSYIQIDTIEGTPPFAIHICDPTYTTCVFSTIINNTSELPVQLPIPTLLTGINIPIVKITDYAGCVKFSPQPCISPTPTSQTPTPTPTPSITPSATQTPTPSITPSITSSVTLTPSITPTISITPSITPTLTPTPTSCIGQGVDTSFTGGTEFNGNVNKIIQLSSGSLIVGGLFSGYNGTSLFNITKLDEYGTLDTSYNSGLFDGNVSDMLLLNDNSIICIGDFTDYDGNSVNNIVKLDSNGFYDSNFVFSANSSVTAFAYDSISNSIYFAGGFTEVNGETHNGIVKTDYNGVIDNSFITTFGVEGTVYQIILTQTYYIYLLGEITSYEGNSVNNIVRILINGVFDYDMGITSIDGRITKGLLYDSESKLILTGNFTQYNNESANGVISVTSGGTNNNIYFGNGFNGDVKDIVETIDGNFLFGGNFTVYNIYVTGRILRLTHNFEFDSNFVIPSGFNDEVKTIVEKSNGTFYVGGNFTAFVQGYGTIYDVGRIIRLYPCQYLSI
jgi:hypothetical protein